MTIEKELLEDFNSFDQDIEFNSKTYVAIGEAYWKEIIILLLSKYNITKK
jgi:hypothetical protein